MKSATIPSLRVTPALRKAAESVLRKGETLSSFVEESLGSQIETRRIHKEFIARGLTARDLARATNTYFSQEEVMESLGKILKRAEKKSAVRIK